MIRNRQTKIEAIIAVSPALLIYTSFFIYPILNLIFMSFQKWNGIPASPKEFVGLMNYARFFTNSKFWISLKNIGIFIASGYILILPAAVFLAHVTQSGLKGNKVLKTLYFIPVVISRTAIAIMWMLLLYPKGGPIIVILENLGLHALAFNWLGDMDFAIYMITIINAWAYAGLNMIIFAAGLSAIPEELYESAEIDGASSFHKLRHITLPMLSETFKIFTVLCIVGSLTQFEMVFVTTRGGPGGATEVFGTLLYKNAFTYNYFGYANSIGVFILIAAIIVTISVNKIFQLREV